MNKVRPKKVPAWINEEVPETLDALKLYRDYCDDEIKHCRSVLKRLQALSTECCRRIEVREKADKQEVFG